MVGLTAAASALSSIKTAYDIAKGVRALEVSTEVRLAITDMLDKLMDAKMEAHEAFDREQALVQQVRDLEAAIGHLKKQTADLENYEPHKFYPGVTAYMLKSELQASAHPHKLCANCYSKGQKSELNPTAKVERRYRQHLCPSCKTEYFMGIEMDPDGPPEQPKPEPRIDYGESSWVSGRR
jgi:hypothetical protein